MTRKLKNADDLFVFVEHDQDNRYKIQSNNLEEIGAKLRGPRHFSVFNSIVLPIMISIVTFLCTGFFQYISWQNSIRLQAATDRATHARNVYDKVATAVGKRIYATFLYLPAVYKLTNRKGDNDSSLFKYDMDLNRRRFDAYFEQLHEWNDNYETFLTEIDYALDRPLLSNKNTSLGDANIFDDSQVIKAEKIKQTDCTKSLSEEVERIGYSRNSLKAQFALLHYCFTHSTDDFNLQKDKAVIDKTIKIDDAIKKSASDNLSNLSAMENEFRCYSLMRINYFENQKESTIFSFSRILMSLIRKPTDKTDKYFKLVDARCGASKGSKTIGANINQ
jgi:hypothetical protein